jgi:hypothetical protein
MWSAPSSVALWLCEAAWETTSWADGVRERIGGVRLGGRSRSPAARTIVLSRPSARPGVCAHRARGGDALFDAQRLGVGLRMLWSTLRPVAALAVAVAVLLWTTCGSTGTATGDPRDRRAVAGRRPDPAPRPAPRATAGQIDRDLRAPVGAARPRPRPDPMAGRCGGRRRDGCGRVAFVRLRPPGPPSGWGSPPRSTTEPTWVRRPGRRSRAARPRPVPDPRRRASRARQHVRAADDDREVE